MRIAICDDEKVCRDAISEFISRYQQDELQLDVAEFFNGEELLAAYKNGANFDFLFLDIQMKDIDGIQVAQKIRETNKHVIIFFITGFTQYVSAAFALDAFQFLVKPISKGEFDREFSRALNKHLMDHKKYILEVKSSIVSLEILDIVYIESSVRHIIVHTEKNHYTKLGKLNDEEKILAPYGFVRTHQSFLVNMAYIYEITQMEIILTNGSRLEISRRKRTDVISRFNKFIKGGSACMG